MMLFAQQPVSTRTPIRRTAALAILALGLAVPADGFEPGGIVAFMTDFGTRDDAAALCKGVMLTIDPDLRIVDLTHDVTAFDVEEGAFYLAEAAGVYPPGTVFVGVVDPGVGTDRRALVVETAGNLVFVVPDNGLVSRVLDTHDLVGAWEIIAPEFMRSHPSPTFHGRDVFAPAGAMLASGLAPPGAAGPPVSDLVRLPSEPATLDGGAVSGRVQLLDKAFGNVWTNIDRELVRALGEVSTAPGGALPDSLEVVVGPARLSVPLVQTFGEVAQGAPLAYFNSRDRLSLAINLGNFAARFGVNRGDSVRVSPARMRFPAGAGSR